MCPETTGKSLEEIDLLFAKEHVRESILAERVTGSSAESKEVDSVRIEKVA
jgi:hypothetical protein